MYEGHEPRLLQDLLLLFVSARAEKKLGKREGRDEMERSLRKVRLKHTPCLFFPFFLFLFPFPVFNVNVPTFSSPNPRFRSSIRLSSRLVESLRVRGKKSRRSTEIVSYNVRGKRSGKLYFLVVFFFFFFFFTIERW